MLAPQFTTRRMLLLIALFSVFFLVLSMAVQQQVWAIALSIGVGTLVLTFLAFAMFFQISFVLAKLVGLFAGTKKPVSPFAKDTAPPVYVAPSNPIE
jgi:hypothetical protein